MQFDLGGTRIGAALAALGVLSAGACGSDVGERRRNPVSGADAGGQDVDGGGVDAGGQDVDGGGVDARGQDVDRVATCAADDTRRIADEQGSPLHLAVNATHVYWTGLRIDPADWTLIRAPREGGPIEVLDSRIGQSKGPVALDGTSAYWGTGDTVLKIPLAGGVAKELAWGQDMPSALAVDTASVYWATATAIRKVALAGGTVTTLASDQDGPTGIAVDEESVYFTTKTAVRKVALGGGAVTTLAPGEDLATSVAVDGTSVYFTTKNAVRKVPLGGGEPETLASKQSKPGGVRVDEAAVYWAENYGLPENGNCIIAGTCPVARLMKRPLDGGTATCPLTLGGMLFDFAVDGADVYAVRAGPGSGQAFIYQGVYTAELR